MSGSQALPLFREGELEGELEKQLCSGRVDAVTDDPVHLFAHLQQLRSNIPIREPQNLEPERLEHLGSKSIRSRWSGLVK